MPLYEVVLPDRTSRLRSEYTGNSVEVALTNRSRDCQVRKLFSYTVRMLHNLACFVQIGKNELYGILQFNTAHIACYIAQQIRTWSASIRPH